MSTSTSNDNESSILPVDFTGITGKGKADQEVPSQLTPDSSLNEILIFARHQGASDVHLGALKPVIFRQYGRLVKITTESLSAEQISLLITAAVPKIVLDR